ncbi:Sensor histidine kinase BtsS [Sutcliffiella rhizosphaerae]|uniref:histidine kinase n=2 Tax=Sutcliffiella rhizosphaerae TaxID=2880967 RepID=A0ABM8YS01_9BACI|nr:Sensor histidine kinase BtsS [Sutcliffiella rhizosphaerae]
MELLPLMVERAGILIVLAFLLSRLNLFRQMVDYTHNLREKFLLIGIFGVFGIVSNYTGITIHEGVISSQAWQVGLAEESAIANTRIMGVTIGGLLGGPLVGIGVGLIAGLHRMTLGGFTAIACGISTILAGVITGLVGKKYNIRKRFSRGTAVMIGVLMEIAQMAVILLVARPYDAAFGLVQIIAGPMIIINGLGTLVFILLIQSILSEEEKTRTLQTHKALYIADQTMPFFRQGLNRESCKKVAEIMLKWTKAEAVAITNGEKVLTHVGVAEDHHIAGATLSTELTRRVLEHRKIMKATSREDIHCDYENCPLQAAVVLPLNAHHQTVGTLKLYYTNPRLLDPLEQELAEGLSKLFSTQLELAEAELQGKLLKDAEIKALQAQIHPHFLFNAINTISALIRTDTDQARKLLLKLSTFFRSNLQGARQILIPLEKELEHVEAYLSIEQARFPSKYVLNLEIEPELKKVLIPPFTLQPLVENAIKHAFSKPDFLGEGIVTIHAFSEGDRMNVVTEDNGRGIHSELLMKLGQETVESKEGTGTALWNIKKRMDEIYGQPDAFRMESRPGQGTKVSITVPVNQLQWGDTYAESYGRG